MHRFAQLRYTGQEHTLEVPVPDGELDDASIAAIRSSFDATSEEAYAFSLAQPVQLVSARVAVSAPGAAVGWMADEPVPDHEPQPREVDLDEHGGVRTVTVVYRGSLEEGRAVPGPCIVEEPASTTLVLPGQTLYRDAIGNLVIEEDG